VPLKPPVVDIYLRRLGILFSRDGEILASECKSECGVQFVENVDPSRYLVNFCAASIALLEDIIARECPAFASHAVRTRRAYLATDSDPGGTAIERTLEEYREALDGPQEEAPASLAALFAQKCRAEGVSPATVARVHSEEFARVVRSVKDDLSLADHGRETTTTNDASAQGRQVWAAYVRDSAGGEPGEGSRDAQRVELGRWADTNDSVLLFYEDLGAPGATDHRPAFNRMLLNLRDDPQLVGVVATTATHFSHKKSPTNGLRTVQSIAETGKAVVLLHHPFGAAGPHVGLPPDAVCDFRDSMSFLLLQIYLTVAGDAREEMRRKASEGMSRRETEGLPFGPPRKAFNVQQAIERIEKFHIPIAQVAPEIVWTTPKYPRGRIGISTNTLKAAIAAYKRKPSESRDLNKVQDEVPPESERVAATYRVCTPKAAIAEHKQKQSELRDMDKAQDEVPPMRKRVAAAYRVCCDFAHRNGRFPTCRELALAMGWKAPTSAWHAIQTMKAHGLVLGNGDVNIIAGVGMKCPVCGKSRGQSPAR
jgi:DNA invertase Pin-like site-specific DNA recombinase